MLTQENQDEINSIDNIDELKRLSRQSQENMDSAKSYGASASYRIHALYKKAVDERIDGLGVE